MYTITNIAHHWFVATLTCDIVEDGAVASASIITGGEIVGISSRDVISEELSFSVFLFLITKRSIIDQHNHRLNIK